MMISRVFGTVLCCGFTAFAAFAQDADVLYKNGNIYTANASHSWVDAVAVRAGRILAVGTERRVSPYVGAGTKVVDLKGSTVFPGLIDAHAHYVRGALRRLYNCDFPGNTRADDIAGKVAACVKTARPGQWIVGGAWASEYIKDNRVSRTQLDDVAPGNPVFLLDDTGHNGLVNTKALEVLGFWDAGAKSNADIVRDANGAPTGILLEAAAGEASKKLPERSDEDYRGAVQWSVGQANAVGITAFVEARTDRATVRAYHDVDEKDGLRARVVTHLQYDTDFNETQVIQAETVKDRAKYQSTRVFTNFVKLYLDGVPPSYTAALLDPYEPSGRPSGFRGSLRMDPARIKADLVEFDKAGIAVKMHATGDASVRAALDAVETARRVNGYSGLRHSIAHVGLVKAEDIPRFAELDVIADVAPPLWIEGPWSAALVKTIGKGRYFDTCPSGDLARAGATLVYGSDWPSISPGINPWEAVQSLVDRSNGSEQRISLEVAIDAITRNAALALRLERLIGALEPGRSADMIILDRNPFGIPVSDIGKTRVLTTIFEGRVVHQADSDK